MLTDRGSLLFCSTENRGSLNPVADFSTHCEKRLRESLAPSGVLFDRQRVGDAWQPTRGTEALTSTAIALIGLSRAAVPPARIGLDPARTLATLLDRTEQSRNPGFLGLVLWAGAVWGEPLAARFLARWASPIGGVPALCRRLRTMELAWLVAGLAHQGRLDSSAATRSSCDQAVAALVGRFNPASRIFWHAEVDSPWPIRVRRHVATFADQIYPVQALALAALGGGHAQALDVASSAALRLVERQGSLGQWWWHYDPRDGRVAGSYPVYSVHQHGMAPMSFRTLALAGGPDLLAAVALGRAWLGHNELHVPLVDPQAGTIWRSIVRAEGSARRLVRHARRLLGPRVDDRLSAVPPALRLNRETRPYEWAWYLFASSLESGLSHREHIA